MRERVVRDRTEYTDIADWRPVPTKSAGAGRRHRARRLGQQRAARPLRPGQRCLAMRSGPGADKQRFGPGAGEATASEQRHRSEQWDRRLNQRQPPCWSRWRVKGIPPAERSGRGAGRGPAWRRHSGARSLSLAAPPRRYATQAHSYRYGSIRLRQRTIRRRTLGCCGKSRGRPDRHGSLPR